MSENVRRASRSCRAPEVPAEGPPRTRLDELRAEPPRGPPRCAGLPALVDLEAGDGKVLIFDESASSAEGASPLPAGGSSSRLCKTFARQSTARSGVRGD